jgi:hypothetical protein
LLLLAACGDDDEPFRDHRDAGVDASSAQKPGVCDLDKCPTSDMGPACCSPLAQCGFDPTGLGLNCVPNQGPTGRVCELAKCSKPTIGEACCTPYGTCGFDPFGDGQICFSIPEPTLDDAGAPTCNLASCPRADGGPAACCTDDGQCGFDSLGVGVCVAPEQPDAGDASTPMTGPPDDPSITKQCPSFIDFDGTPVWGCCSAYALCGTFAQGVCLLPPGTEIPAGPVSSDEDGGTDGTIRCTPPVSPR